MKDRDTSYPSPLRQKARKFLLYQCSKTHNIHGTTIAEDCWTPRSSHEGTINTRHGVAMRQPRRSGPGPTLKRAALPRRSARRAAPPRRGLGGEPSAPSRPRQGARCTAPRLLAAPVPRRLPIKSPSLVSVRRSDHGKCSLSGFDCGRPSKQGESSYNRDRKSTEKHTV